LLAALAFASSAGAVTMYVSPDGAASSGCYYDIPCSLDAATKLAVPGDTIVLKDGVYKQQGIYPPANTQPATPAYITWQADECALPIIEGAGVGPLEDNQDSGMYADAATYLRFVGIAMRGWSSGFSNKFQDTDPSTPPTSNGHFEYINCIADGNGRTGFTMFSADGLHIKNSIAAHNGSSILHSWSSGITLLEVQGDALIEGNISFENMDNHDVAQAPDSPGKHSDGNGFIVDENSNGATFVNNVGFRNGGSCLRLTRSSGTKFINNTCYHNAQDTMATGPTNPSEVYFTLPSSGQTDPRTGVTFMNNIFWATGSAQAMMAIYQKPTSGWMNNIEATSGTAPLTAPDGTNPDFTLSAGATAAIDKGGANAAAPTDDVGFDPKCIVKKAPTPIGMMTQGSWWQYSIDYDYIKSIGGIAKCFNSATRDGTNDIGAYNSGPLKTSPVTTCTPTIPPDHAGPGGGTAGAGGTASTGGGAGTAAGTTGTTTGGTATGGTATGGTGSSSGGGVATGAGTGPGTGGAGTGTAGTAATGISAGTSSATPNAPATTDDGGCGCRIGQQPSRSSLLLGVGAFGALLLGLRRRRQSRR